MEGQLSEPLKAMTEEGRGRKRGQGREKNRDEGDGDNDPKHEALDDDPLLRSMVESAGPRCRGGDRRGRKEEGLVLGWGG